MKRIKDHLSMLDAHQLNIFLTAAETLNFTQAAQRLHMSQPSVSQHIRTLEKHFGTKLFIRKGRSIALSDAGRTLLPLARRFVKQSTVIDETMSSLHGRIQGRIIMGCNAEIGKYILPIYLKRFHDAYPDITITCRTRTCPGPVHSLLDGTLHFLVTNDTEELNRNFETNPIAEEEIVLIVPPQHPWTDRDEVLVDDLLQEQVILQDEDSNFYQRVAESLYKQGIEISQLDTFLHLGNTEAIILSVEKGLGIGFAHRTIANIIGDVRILPIKDLNITRTMYIARDKNQPATAARQAFWEFMSEVNKEIQLNGVPV